MKDTMAVIAIGVTVICLVVGVVFVFRYLSSVATPIAVKEVAPGVTCASMVTSDGAAISCWKNN